MTNHLPLKVHLWDITTKKRQWQVQGHNGQVWSITGAPDGNSFFTVGNDKTIKRWSLEGNDLPIDTWICDVSILYNRIDDITESATPFTRITSYVFYVADLSDGPDTSSLQTRVCDLWGASVVVGCGYKGSQVFLPVEHRQTL